MLRIAYIVFLGLLLALFIGVGISVFYPQPKAPEAPAFFSTPTEKLTEEQRDEEIRHEKESLAYQKQLEPYNRNVAVIALAFSVILLMAGLLLASRIGVMSEGVLLGSIFTLLYSIGRGLASGDSVFQFITVTVGLVIALGLGYVKFLKPQEA